MGCGQPRLRPVGKATWYLSGLSGSKLEGTFLISTDDYIDQHVNMSAMLPELTEMNQDVELPGQATQIVFS